MRNIVTTRTLAESLGVSPEAIRSTLHYNGHYCGMVPKRMPPHAYLRWPANAAERVRRYKAKQAAVKAARKEANRKKWIAYTCKKRMEQRRAEGRPLRGKYRRRVETVDTEKARAALMSAFAATL